MFFFEKPNQFPSSTTQFCFSMLEEAVKLTKHSKITIVMGDLNAKIGQGCEGDHLSLL